MRMFPLAFIAILASGCAAVGSTNVVRFDLGPLPSPRQPGPGLLLRAVEVRSPLWLASPTMQYRLAYTAEPRRDTYAQSRWVAAPAELLEHALKGRLLAAETRIPLAGCRLAIELGEFVQVFDAPGASRALLEVRAVLFAPRGDLLLARRGFAQSAPAGPDARAGAAAFAAASALLGDDIVFWLGELARDAPDVASRCRGSN